MVKVLYLPLNYGDVVQKGMYDAFREAGAQLEIFDYYYNYEQHRRRVNKVRQELINFVAKVEPDLMHMQIQHTKIIDRKTVATLRNRHPKMIISNWTGDVRNYIPRTYKDVAGASHFNFISSTGQLEKFRHECHGNVDYWQIGYDPKLYYPNPNKKKDFTYDCVFIANNNTTENYPGRSDRELACRLLRQAFGSRFGLFGNGWPRSLGSKGSIDQKRVSSVYHDSVCAISISHFNDINHYFSDRLLMCLASGRPTVSLRFPKWQSYFTNNCDLVIADSVEQIVEKVKELKADPHKADFIGESGAAKVAAEHTYLSRVYELFDKIGLR